MEISEYSYVLTKAGITSKYQQTMSQSRAFQDDTANAVQNGLSVYNEITGVAEGRMPDINTVSTDISSLEDYFSDPKKLGQGVVAVLKSAAGGIISEAVTSAVCKGILKRELEGLSGGMDADAYLQKLGVENGLAGLSFEGSNWAGGRDSTTLPEIRVVISWYMDYKLFDYFEIRKLHFRICAETALW